MQFVIWILIYKGRYCMRKQEYQVKPTPDIHTHTKECTNEKSLCI